ncbi:MAG: metal-sensitive transcriptional regulator [Bacillota bacterium]
MTESKQELKGDIINRLKKIEGQVKGIQKMIEDDKCCGEVMVQISAIRSAINRVGGIVMDRYIRECMLANLKKQKSFDNDDELNEMIETIVKYVK